MPGTPATGGDDLRWILRRLSRHDLGAMGHYTESADSLYQLMRAIRDFWIGGYLGDPSSADRTDSVVVVDEEGNVAAAQYSIYTLLWGTTGIFVGGVSIPDTGCFLQHQILETGPGELLPNPGNALIAYRNGRPALATASIGSVVAVTVQALVDMIDHGSSPKRAEGVPTVRRPDFSDPRYPLRVTAGAFDTALLEAVRGMGIPIIEEQPGEERAVGAWSGLIITPSGRILGATSNIYNGWAEGY